ncbi:hypothetical protein LLG46_01175 [bacterium]|nr:hypothetical protein [bacterium]
MKHLSCLVILGMLVCCTVCCESAEKHPAKTATVIAEGEAPADLPNAKEKAVADALRNAIMKGLGTYIDSVTVGRNYSVVRDEILLKPNGYATCDQVLSSSTEKGLFKVKVKATVSNRPLAQMLKALGLTRQWRVGVLVSDSIAKSAVCKQLISAGFSVIDDKQQRCLKVDASAAGAVNGDEDSLRTIGSEFDVDILVTGQASVDYVDQDDYGGVTLYRSRGRMDTKAYYTDTGELLTSTSACADGLDQTKSLSAEAGLNRVGLRIGTILAEDLLVAPADMMPFIYVKITGFKGIMAANSLEDVIRDLPGITQLKRRRYTSGVLELNVFVKSDYKDDLPKLIENCSAAKRLGLKVEKSTKTCLLARLTKG